jgi:hypothetical protein
MGKLIICNGKSAKQPYSFTLTNTKVYSIEELCYYIFNHIDSINEDIFTDSLVLWIKEELDLEKEANDLEGLIERKAPLKDMVVSVLCSSDYYAEVDIKQLLQVMDEIGKLTPMEKKKKKADNYLKYSQYTKAVSEYEKLLNSPDAAKLNGIQYGDLLHNLALARLNTVGFLAASLTFKEAYKCNHNRESLKQYFFTLLLSNQESILKQELESLGINQEMEEQIKAELQNYLEDAIDSQDYQIINELTECKDSGKIVPFYQMAGELINGWIQEFRLENS